MTVRVGINGFGRMGRLGLRAGWACANFLENSSDFHSLGTKKKRIPETSI